MYAIIVPEGFCNTADNPWAHKRLIEYLKAFASPALYHFAFRVRQKLPSLIDDVWPWERVIDDLASLGQPRWERLLAAGRQACVCQGTWRHCAEWCWAANGINPVEFSYHICQSMYHGRCESLPGPLQTPADKSKVRGALVMTRMFGCSVRQAISERNMAEVAPCLDNSLTIAPQ